MRPLNYPMGGMPHMEALQRAAEALAGSSLAEDDKTTGEYDFSRHIPEHPLEGPISTD